MQNCETSPEEGETGREEGREGEDGGLEGLVGGGGMPSPMWLDEHLRRKVLHFSWHPFEECVAVAGRSSLFIYNGI